MIYELISYFLHRLIWTYSHYSDDEIGRYVNIEEYLAREGREALFMGWFRRNIYYNSESYWDAVRVLLSLLQQEVSTTSAERFHDHLVATYDELLKRCDPFLRVVREQLGKDVCFR